jgi:uncharacterized protein YbjT (DUF2867 family)
MSRILVSGASGLSGAAIVRELSLQKLPVRALVRSKARASALADLSDVELHEGDMLRPETLEPAFDGVDRAVLISSTSPQMVETQCTFVDAARSAGIRHVLKFSGKESNTGFDQSRFRFTRMHAEIERYLEGSGLAWTHLRPSQFMQVYLREVPTIVANGALFLPLEAVSLAPIDVDDIARVIVALLKGGPVHEAKGYDLTGPEALTMAEIAERISQATATPVRFVPVTPQERRNALIAKGLPLHFVDAFDEQAKERLRCPEAGVDVAIARSLGVRLATFGEFARRHAAEFRGNATVQPGVRP